MSEPRRAAGPRPINNPLLKKLSIKWQPSVEVVAKALGLDKALEESRRADTEVPRG